MNEKPGVDQSLHTADLSGPHTPPARTLAPPIGEGPGDQIGPYKLLEPLGEGGFGVVWLAERREPFVQRVAMKIIKAGMDTKAVIARFEQERQALAVMDHPSIAQVYDAGTTGAGRPYFVMEHVAGAPITDYCDKHKLTLRDRLEVFIPVCEAVQHAHMKGIIHRDLKPSNILVGVHGDKALPKVIDFGVAKAISQTLSHKTIYTEMGQMIGTPEYMSPEQAEMRGTDIDTRADIYSLGAVLYELLTGALPFDSERLRSSGFGEIQRIIREDEPPKPSMRLTGLGMKASSVIASSRRVQHHELLRQLKRELDWILMKALDKDRTRRYPSASEFVADIKRYLGNEPVTAGPPSARYRLKKFIVRHKLGVTAAAFVALAVVLGAVGTTVGWVRANRAQKLASFERDRAVVQARISDESAHFLTGLFSVADPSEDRGKNVTAREILAKGAARIETELASTPATQASLMATMANALRSLGLNDDADPLYQKALAKRRSLLADAPAADRAEAQAAVADVLNQYANLLVKKGKPDAAEPLAREALDTRRALFGQEHPAVAESLNDLAYILQQKGDFAGAETLYRQALDQRRHFFPEPSKQVADTLRNLALDLFDKGDDDVPMAMLRDALSMRRKVFGQLPHPDLAESLNDLAFILYQRGEYDKAIPLFQEALDVEKKLVGEKHLDVAMAMNNIAFVLHESGDLAGAERIYRKALDIEHQLQIPANHPDVAKTLNNLATLLGDKGDYPEAERFARESLEMYKKVDGDEHPDVAQGMNNLARWLQEQGKMSEAESLFRDALAMRRKILPEPDKHPAVAVSMTSLANFLVEAKRYDEALKLATEARAVNVAAFAEDHWRTAVVDGVIGAALSGQGKFDQAEPLLLKSYKALSKKEKGVAIYLKDARRRLVALYEAWNKPDAAAPYRAQATAGASSSKN